MIHPLENALLETYHPPTVPLNSKSPPPPPQPTCTQITTTAQTPNPAPLPRRTSNPSVALFRDSNANPT
jgi:hypothetical protein